MTSSTREAEAMTAQLSPAGGRDVHTVRFPVATPPSEIEVLVVGAGHR
jgi:hypothetical protein